jgi:hypothetical protein
MYGNPTLKARFTKMWSSLEPFDRHDWVVDRCGKEVCVCVCVSVCVCVCLSVWVCVLVVYSSCDTVPVARNCLTTRFCNSRKRHSPTPTLSPSLSSITSQVRYVIDYYSIEMGDPADPTAPPNVITNHYHRDPTTTTTDDASLPRDPLFSLQPHLPPLLRRFLRNPLYSPL